MKRDRQTKPSGAGTRPMSQRQAAAAAGMSKHQEKQAKRLAQIPEEEFERLIESDRPPSVTALAAMGTRRKPAAAAPRTAEGRRPITELTIEEWGHLIDDFADLVLHRHRVIGSVANIYSLYEALDNERLKALRRQRHSR